eukprot:1139784-Pyramimonas_sp.AAC.1
MPSAVVERLGWLGDPLEAFWGSPGSLSDAFWAFLGAIWAPLVALLGALGALLEPSWRRSIKQRGALPSMVPEFVSWTLERYGAPLG